MLSRVGNLTSQLTSPGIIPAGPAEVADRDADRVPARGGLRPRDFRRVREYILVHLADNITNRVLAELVGLSSWYFARAFKQTAGLPPHRFLLQSRIDRVKQLLVETDLPLAQIAVLVGFADQSHCTRRFRELVGVTPSRFRWLSQ